MSQKNSKKNSLRQTSIMRSKMALKANKIGTDPEIKSFKKLPLIKQRKCSSSKNLIASNTCEIPFIQQDLKLGQLSILRKAGVQKNKQRNTLNEIEPINVKYFFQKRKNAIQPLDENQLKKYSSCNKFISFPSIPDLGIPNDESYIHNDNGQNQRQVKSSNSIKLDTIQYVKKPKLQSIPLKKILKSHLSKTINPRKIESEHSIELQNQNEEKNQLVKKRSKLSKCSMFDRIDSKTKILVKNPFKALPKKHLQLAQRIEIQQNLESLQRQFRLSKIYEDTNDQSQISLSGKSDLQNLIGFMKS